MSAAAKSVIVLVGTPAAIWRMWLSTPSAAPRTSVATVIHLVLIASAIAWLWASVRLGRDVIDAWKRPDALSPTRWSTRWAIGLVGLSVVFTSGWLTSGRTGVPSAVRAQRPVATASAPARAESGRMLAARAEHGLEHAVVHRQNLESTLTIGIGILAAIGVANDLRLARRRRAARRRPLQGPVPLDPDLRALAERIDAAASSSLLALLERANRTLHADLRAAGPATTPKVVLVRVNGDGVELLLDDAHPEGTTHFSAIHEGRWWSYAATTPDATDDPGEARFLPSLVPIGDDGQSAYLAVLDVDRPLILRGKSMLLASACSTLQLALSVMPWKAEMTSIIEMLERSAEAIRPSSLGHAPDSADDAPLVLALGLDAIEMVTDGARMRDANASRLWLSIEATGISIEPFGLILCQGITAMPSARLIRLLIERSQAVLPLTSLLASSRKQPSIDLATTAPDLHVLGRWPVATGRLHELGGLELELVCYLAWHDDGSQLSELAGELLGGADPSRMQLLETLIRRLAELGLVQLEETRWQLCAELTTDWSQLLDILSEARGAPLTDGDTIELLHQAIKDVAGRPLGESGYHWLEGEQLAGVIDAVLIDAAHELALRALSRKEIELAQWAIDKGRLVDATSEIIFRDQLTLLSAQHDASALESAYRAFDNLLEAVVHCPVSDETRAFYDHLRGGCSIADADQLLAKGHT